VENKYVSRAKLTGLQGGKLLIMAEMRQRTPAYSPYATEHEDEEEDFKDHPAPVKSVISEAISIQFDVLFRSP